jgi:hypothetical protein
MLYIISRNFTGCFIKFTTLYQVYYRYRYFHCTMPLFTNNDYNSDSGMQSAVWGPAVWHILHITSFNYPVKPTESDKKHYTDWLMSFQYTLPCVYCRDNFKNNLKNAKFTQSAMKNRATFSRFIYEFHNCVNKMLEKTIHISFNDVRDRYEHFRSRCVDTKKPPPSADGKERGCVGALHGTKSKCVIRIVPKTSKQTGFKMDSKCKTKNKLKK